MISQLFLEMRECGPVVRRSPGFLKFQEFHSANPHVYELFRDRALELHRAGVRHYGARAIGEVIRYAMATIRPTDQFRINDHIWPYLARLAMKREPCLEGFFECRGDLGTDDAAFDDVSP